MPVMLMVMMVMKTIGGIDDSGDDDADDDDADDNNYCGSGGGSRPFRLGAPASVDSTHCHRHRHCQHRRCY